MLGSYVSSRASRKTPRSPRLADKALVSVMQATEVFEP